MRRVLDFLGITRPRGTPRPKLITAIVGGVGLFLVLYGIAVWAGNAATSTGASVWIGVALIVVGLACWVVEGVLGARTKGQEPPR
ncbi:hypothetical protein DEJ13_08545 [Curtobacterium sp. MCLR17_007]|uniref:DUF2207 domain-containing protein n=1 Tax=Curtobacterium sp. MCLR17_007 TaxID=2175648 RepID=UPI0011B4C3AC|nr:DUF2207 domain-containing protein [Curtobacterium sp. MCLR17_007]WIB61866.1 hypothetical protein DEJ13_08545 [Curtobacterium sp. MCLR17_007]